MNMLMRRIEAMWITGSSVCRDMDNWLQCFTFQLESLYCIYYVLLGLDSMD